MSRRRKRRRSLEQEALLRHPENAAKAAIDLKGADGFRGLTTPSAPALVAFGIILFDGAATPPLPGGE